MASIFDGDDSLAALNPGRRLTYLIGLVSQEDVLLEHVLRHLGNALVGVSVAVHIAPLNVDPLLQQCIVMVEKSDLGERLSAALQDALSAAERAHRERNRVVHDLWLPNLDGTGETDPGVFKRHQRKKNMLGGVGTVKTLAEIEEAWHQLRRARLRLHMAPFLLPPWHDFPQPNDGIDHREMNTRIMEDRFDITPEGGIRAQMDPPDELGIGMPRSGREVE